MHWWVNLVAQVHVLHRVCFTVLTRKYGYYLLFEELGVSVMFCLRPMIAEFWEWRNEELRTDCNPYFMACSADSNWPGCIYSRSSYFLPVYQWAPSLVLYFLYFDFFNELCLLRASQPHVWASWCFWKHNRNSGPGFCIMVCLFLLGYCILIDTHHHELWSQLVVCHCYLWWILMLWALWATLTRLWPHLLSSILQIVFIQKSLQFHRYPSVF
jgi:hypothetical protein